jgi:two-component system nitrogen regulation sensor histidine kinase GlnL
LKEVGLGRELRTVLDAVPDGVIVLDVNGKVEQVNAEACRILQSSDDALRELAVERLLGPEHALARLARGVLAEVRSTRASDQRVERRLEDDLLVDVAVSPLVDSNGRLDGVVIVLRDRTLQHTLQSQVEGRQRLDAFGRVAAGLAHEIKNPLGGIRGAAELIAMRSEDAKTKEAAELVAREARRIATLVDDFTVFAERDALRVEETNLHRVLDGVLDLLAVDPVSVHAEVERHFDPSIPELLADPDRLTQIFLNLARNALQAMAGDGGTLSISTRMHLDQRLAMEDGARLASVAVEIRDTGSGIPAELLEQVRTPFFTTRAEGTGLGLAVADYWAARHGGVLSIESVPSEGTTVRVLLPLRRKR